MKASRGNPHKLIITLSNLFTTPLATGIPFSWKDLTRSRMMALDEFVLWVNAETPYKIGEGIHRGRQGSEPGTFKMGGTGSKQEDQIITVAIEKATGAKFTYIPFRGGGEVAVQLVGKHVDSTVNNPIEAVAQWRGELGAPALRVRRQAARPTPSKVAGDTVMERHSDLQVAGPRRRVPDAARHLHGCRAPPRTRLTTTSTCSRRCAKRRSGRR